MHTSSLRSLSADPAALFLFRGGNGRPDRQHEQQPYNIINPLFTIHLKLWIVSQSRGLPDKTRICPPNQLTNPSAIDPVRTQSTQATTVDFCGIFLVQITAFSRKNYRFEALPSLTVAHSKISRERLKSIAQFSLQRSIQACQVFSDAREDNIIFPKYYFVEFSIIRFCCGLCSGAE